MIYFNHSAQRMTEQSTFVLLHQLRERLRLVNERRAERRQESELRIGIQSLVAAGALTELHSEAAFLDDLIGQIEQEGVRP